MSRPDYTRQAVAAVVQAARAEHDFAGWLAQVLAAAAGQLGSSDALTAGRPGSWEASYVDQLVKGTVGYGDEYLPAPAGRARLTDAQVRQIRERRSRPISRSSRGFARRLPAARPSAGLRYTMTSRCSLAVPGRAELAA